MEQLKQEVLKCQKCELCKTKINYVFGEGSVNSKIMFIGEAPGANEDKTGKPFVGRAGEVFDKLLKSISINRNSIYICNILKCRPPKNRNPFPDEILSCTPYLNLQIDKIKPKVICTLGNYATMFILKKYMLHDKLEGISKLHGKVFKITNLFGTMELIPLYHPAVATYNPDMIDVLIKDFKLLEGRE